VTIIKACVVVLVLGFRFIKARNQVELHFFKFALIIEPDFPLDSLDSDELESVIIYPLESVNNTQDF